MATRVQITLTALNGNLSPPQRTFVLDQARPNISIGRASKNESKGLQSAADNAWFDSPVMSREHAKLSFDLLSKTVLINDIGSMHGTLLNGNQIPKSTQIQINSSDVLVFGAEVRRGPETFPACTFSIKYEIIPQDIAESQFDQEERQDRLESNGEDDHVEERCGHISQASDPIDLTRDESPVHLFTAAESGNAQAEMSDLQSDSEDGDAVYTRRHISYGFSDDSEDDQEDSEDIDLSEGADSTDSEVDYIGYRAADSDEESDIVDQDEQDNDSVADSDALIPRSPFSASDCSDYQGERQDDVDLDEAGADGLRVMAESGLLETPPEPSYNYSQYRTRYVSDCSSPIAELVAANLGSAMQPPTQYAYITSPLFEVPRDPSPSDAAMAKPSDIYHMPAFQSQQASSKVLGEKTGKEDFFKAREHNKTTLNASNTTVFRTSVEEEHKLPSIQDMENAAKHPQPRKFAIPRKPRNFSHSSFATYTPAPPNVDQSFSFAPPSVPSILDKLDQVSITYRTPSPLLDMTSAVKFNASKATATAAGDTTNAAPQTTRSGLRIDEIIEKNLTGPAGKLKRSADEISSTVEEEVRLWAASNNQDVSDIGVQRRTVDNEPLAQDALVARVSEQDSRKRLRKFMESAAYLTLGGIAAFGALVATAPDLL